MMVDLILNYQEALQLTNDEIFNILQDKFSNKELYDMSLGWRESKDYILKCYGVNGDIIVGWN